MPKVIDSNADDGPGERRLKLWWALGEGRTRWQGSPTPWRTLRAQLAAKGVPKRMLDGLTTNIFKLAGQPMPNSREARLANLKPEHKAALRKAAERSKRVA